MTTPSVSTDKVRKQRHGAGQKLAVGLFVLLVTALAVAACQSGKGASENSPTGNTSGAQYSGALLVNPLPKADFTLTDTSGRPFNFVKDTEGYVTILFFGYSHCPDTCPLFLATVAQAMHSMPESATSKIRVVVVTVDPQRDTPEVMWEWLANFDAGFIGLTGRPDEVMQVEEAYGLPPVDAEKLDHDQLDYFVEHFGGAFVYTMDGKAHLMYPASGLTPEDWSNDLARLVVERWT